MRISEDELERHPAFTHGGARLSRLFFRQPLPQDLSPHLVRRRLQQLTVLFNVPLVLDEPSEGLAPVIVDELGDVFARLGREDTGILLIEQNFSLVRCVPDSYYVLSKGAIVDRGKLRGLSLETLKQYLAVQEDGPGREGGLQ